jgi:16S rRNA (uracil1498-N3)-methyltransferase
VPTHHRFYISPERLAASPVELLPEAAHQISRVLRMLPGERITLFSGDGSESLAELREVDGRRVTAEVVKQTEPDVEMHCHLHVAVALLKGEKLDLVVQKLTELGAARISFLRTERGIAELQGERWSRRHERFQKIITEAAEQSGRVRVPDIGVPQPLSDVIPAHDGRVLFLAPEAELSLARALKPLPERLLLLIGPEGGFTRIELARAKELGAEPVRLGSRTMRAETAAIAAAALVVGSED